MVREYWEVIDDLEYSRVQFFQTSSSVTYLRRNQSCFELHLPNELVNALQFQGCFYFRSINRGPWTLVSAVRGRAVLTTHLRQILGHTPSSADLWENHIIPDEGPGVVLPPDSYPIIQATRVGRVRRAPRQQPLRR